MELPNELSYIYVFHVSIPIHSGLWLIHHDVVLVSPFVGPDLLLMIMFVGYSFLVIQSGLPSDIISLESGSCSVGWDYYDYFLLPVIMWCMHQWGCYIWVKYSVMLGWSCPYENVLYSSSSILNMFPEVLLCSYWSTVCVSCCSYLAYQSLSLCWCRSIPGVIHLFHYTMHLWATIFILGASVDLIGKENESLQVSLTLMFLSCHVFGTS